MASKTGQTGPCHFCGRQAGTTWKWPLGGITRWHWLCGEHYVETQMFLGFLILVGAVP